MNAVQQRTKPEQALCESARRRCSRRLFGEMKRREGLVELWLVFSARWLQPLVVEAIVPIAHEVADQPDHAVSDFFFYVYRSQPVRASLARSRSGRRR
jgi:hypothetical protein